MMKNRRGRIDLLTQEQIDWCNKYCDFSWFVKDDGKVYSNNEKVCFKNKKMIDSFPVKFGDCDFFSCYDCKSLKSLKGAPKKIRGGFDCIYCKSLESLEGVSESVGGYFNCSDCISLKTLKGMPKNIGEYFNCAFCHSLISLEGVPKNINGDFGCSFCHSLRSLEGVSKNISGSFDCTDCISLETLEGVPKSVGADFCCGYCKLLKSIDELKNTKIDGKIICDECSKLEKYYPILDDMKLFRRWQKSEYIADEFLKEYSGFIEAKKYGI